MTFTQIPTFTLLLIVCAVHPENRMQSNVMIDATLVRLHITTLCDPVIDPAIKELLLLGIAFTDFDIALTLHDIKDTN